MFVCLNVWILCCNCCIVLAAGVWVCCLLFCFWLFGLVTDLGWAVLLCVRLRFVGILGAC